MRGQATSSRRFWACGSVSSCTNVAEEDFLKYDRTKAFGRNTTLSMRRYLRDQAELNRFYWAARLSADTMQAHVKSNPSTDADTLIKLLGVQSQAAARLTDQSYSLKQSLSVVDRWLRLTTLLVALSAFERYLLAAASSAISSDPAPTSTWPKKLDGLYVKKHKIEILTPPLEGLTKGEWPSRSAVYQKLFGGLPPELSGSIGQLELMRKMRNGVAHEVAYDSAAASIANTSLLIRVGPEQGNLKSFSLSARRLISWLSILNKVAKAVDRQLVVNHVGGFEVPSVYLDWMENPQAFEEAAGVILTGHRKSSGIRFRHAVAPFFGPIGNEYDRTMREYINLI